jgi:hypothetical protein
MWAAPTAAAAPRLSFAFTDLFNLYEKIVLTSWWGKNLCPATPSGCNIGSRGPNPLEIIGGASQPRLKRTLGQNIIWLGRNTSKNDQSSNLIFLT